MKKKIIHTLSSIFPQVFVNLAYKQLTNPQIHQLRDSEIALLNQATQSDFPFKGFNIKTYQWGIGSKKILLIHGWEGQAGNFAALIQELLENDYTVYAFDGPSHGFSSKGKTSLFEFTELVGVLIRKFEVKHLVSHSFGGVATTYALYDNLDLKIDKYVLLTTPDKFSERIQDVCNKVGISNKVRDRLISRLEKEIGSSIKGFNVSDFVQEIHVNKALIIHDKNDKVIPIQQSINVNQSWEACELEVIEGTGHFRILKTKSVLDKVIGFMENELVLS